MNNQEIEMYDKFEKKVSRPYEEKENCCGCSACYSICPNQAIEMLPDEEGFIYPVIYDEKCSNCNKCISVCAFRVDQEKRHV